MILVHSSVALTVTLVVEIFINSQRCLQSLFYGTYHMRSYLAQLITSYDHFQQHL